MSRFIIPFIKRMILSLMGLIVGLTLFLSTDVGKAQLTLLITPFLKSLNYKIKIKQLKSFFPLIINIETIALLEKDKIWLELGNVDFSFDIFAYFLDQQIKTTMRIDTLQLLKLPQEEASASSKRSSHLSLPHDLVCNGYINHFFLSEQVLGYSLKGTLSTCEIGYKHGQDKFLSNLKLTLESAKENLDLDIKGQGKLNDFSVVCTFSGREIKIRDFQAQVVYGKANFTHLPWKIDAKTTINFKHENQEGRFASDIFYQNGLFQCEHCTLAAKGVYLAGAMTYNQQNDALKAQFVADIHNTQLLSILLQIPINGEIKAKGFFNRVGGDIDFVMDAKGINIDTPYGKVASVSVNTNLKNALNNPEGTFDLGAENITSNYEKIEYVKANVLFRNGLGQVKGKVDGRFLKGDVLLDINYTHPIKTFVIKALKGQYKDINFHTKKGLRISLEGSKLTLFPSQLVVLDSLINLKGAMNDKNLNFKLNGEIDLWAVTQMFLYSGDKLQGKLALDIAIQGTTSSPSLSGTLDLKEGFYENAVYGTKFKDIKLKATANPTKLVMHQAMAHDGKGGKIALQGDYNISKDNLNLKIKTNGFTFVHTDQMQIVIRNGELVMKRSISLPELTGNIIIDRADYDISQETKPEIYSINVINLPKRPIPSFCITLYQEPSYIFDMKLDIKIVIPPVLKIYGLGLTSIWKGDMTLKKTLSDPLIVGTLKLDVGALEFLSQKITLSHGTVRFDGSPDHIPLVETQGEIKKRDNKILIGVTGKVNKPKISLESEPYMPKDEILSSLLFGKKMSMLSPFQAVSLARALTAYNNPSQTNAFSKLMTSNFGLDQFSLGTNEETGEYSVKLSQRLNDNVRVNINQGLNPEDSTVEVEIDLTDNVSVATEHGWVGSSDSISLKYNWDY